MNEVHGLQQCHKDARTHRQIAYLQQAMPTIRHLKVAAWPNLCANKKSPLEGQLCRLTKKPPGWAQRFDNETPIYNSRLLDEMPH